MTRFARSASEFHCNLRHVYVGDRDGGWGQRARRDYTVWYLAKPLMMIVVEAEVRSQNAISLSRSFFKENRTQNSSNMHNYSCSTPLRRTAKISSSTGVMHARIEPTSSTAVFSIQFKNFSRIFWRKRNESRQGNRGNSMPKETYEI